MSAVYAAGKSAKSSVTKNVIKDIFLNFTRNRESRFLGYYKFKLMGTVYRQRESDYRKNVLKPLEEIPSLQDRLKELNMPDPVLDEKVNIGFTKPMEEDVSLKDRLAWRKEIRSRKLTVEDLNKLTELDLADIRSDWMKSNGLESLQNIADHYGVFSDLYHHGYFTPCLPLNISYEYDADSITPVFSGNILQASDVAKAPSVEYESKPDSLWTLVMTNLDGHLLDTKSEYLHWCIGNIKGNDLKSGEILCDYLQPFPMRGSGYHRIVFVLYRQNKKIDFNLKKASSDWSLEDRTFKTFDFYKEHQDLLTPAGLAFFQCTWDESLTNFFHNVLNMHEPIFEYMEPPPYRKKQVHFPHLEPFNKYLDKYRDEKEIKKEVLLKRLKNVHPFQEEPPVPKYPMLHKPENFIFTWQKDDMILEQLRLGKYRDLRPHSVYPQEDNQYKDPNHG